MPRSALTPRGVPLKIDEERRVQHDRRGGSRLLLRQTRAFPFRRVDRLDQILARLDPAARPDRRSDHDGLRHSLVARPFCAPDASLIRHRSLPRRPPTSRVERWKAGCSLLARVPRQMDRDLNFCIMRLRSMRRLGSRMRHYGTRFVRGEASAGANHGLCQRRARGDY